MGHFWDSLWDTPGYSWGIHGIPNDPGANLTVIMEMVNRKIIKSNFQCVTFAVKGTHVLRKNGEYLK